MMKFADDLIGKGLSAWVIIKLTALSLGFIVVLAIPMAVLVATLMAFGSMSQNNEVAILKATGVSLYKMMIPPLAASILVAFGLVYFNNNVYPDANHALRLLQEDIMRKKPTLSLVSGVFSQEVPGYSILAREVDSKNNELRQITIYDNSTPPKSNVVTAEYGKIYFSSSIKKLMMDLRNGEIHESDNAEKGTYRRLRFERHKMALPGDQFTFEQSAPGGPRGDRELGAKELKIIADSLEKIRAGILKEFDSQISSQISFKNRSNSGLDSTQRKQFVYLRSQQKIRADEESIKNIIARLDFNDKEIDRYWVEIHKKYSLPFACIVFVLIGAPLGTMTRKGGIGMAAGVSLLFFFIYWAFIIGGEKLADRNLVSPFLGIWSANILLSILGITLMIKSAREKVTLNFDFITRLIPKSWKQQEENDENS